MLLMVLLPGPPPSSSNGLLLLKLDEAERGPCSVRDRRTGAGLLPPPPPPPPPPSKGLLDDDPPPPPPPPDRRGGREEPPELRRGGGGGTSSSSKGLLLDSEANGLVPPPPRRPLCRDMAYCDCWKVLLAATGCRERLSIHLQLLHLTTNRPEEQPSQVCRSHAKITKACLPVKNRKMCCR